MTENVELKDVLGTMMQMVQYYTNHMNYEMLRILHETNHCSEFVQVCMICKQEETERLNAEVAEVVEENANE